MLNWLLLPSFLCLDAPLVAVGWALCLALESSPGTSQTTAIPALFLAVWAVYLADRLFDARRLAPDAPCSRRHAFAKRHPRLLLGLLAAASAAILLWALPRLDPSIVLPGGVVAAVTLLYYALFRFTRLHRFVTKGFPAKELAIGATFACGIGLAAGRPLWTAPVQFLALSSLLAGNCLAIGAAERHLDERTDEAAFFSLASRSALWPRGLLAAAFALGTLLSIIRPSAFSLSIPLAAAATWALTLPRRDGRPLPTQAIADGILLVPWLLLLANSLLGFR